jgi:hypothetical protein
MTKVTYDYLYDFMIKFGHQLQNVIIMDITFGKSLKVQTEPLQWKHVDG